MTKERLEEIKRLCDAATPGPWNSHAFGVRRQDYTHVYRVERGLASVGACNADNEFIAASRATIPELLAAHEKAVEQSKLSGKLIAGLSYHIKELLKGGEHDGPCDNEGDDIYEDNGCQKHIDTYNARASAARKFMESNSAALKEIENGKG